MNLPAKQHEIPRILTHRGTLDFLPESGLQGFRFAIENGLTGFETVFRKISDETRIVMHDSD